MKKLLLIRHAHAENSSDTGKDIDRKLTSEGMKNASLLGKYIKEEEITIDALITSNASRAQLTAELISGPLGYDLNQITVVADLYEISVRGLFDFICRLSNERSTVAIVGHNPTLSYMADYLSDQVVHGMSPASLVQINFEVDSWTALTKGQGAFIGYYDLPTY